MQRQLLLLICGLLFFSTIVFSQTLPAGFSTSNIGSGWNAPVGATFTSDGQKLFVWEKGGAVYVCTKSGSNYTKQTKAVINIGPEVGDWRDHGLLGFALDPNFQSNGFIYLLYVVDRHHLMNYGKGSQYGLTTNTYYQATIGRITRYTTMLTGDGIVADTMTRKVLVGETKKTGMPILYESHGVGSLAFAADGTLLATCGDGASYSTTDAGSVGHTYYIQALADTIITAAENVGAFRSQLLNSLSGKLLRIDPTTGDGIPSNPYYSAAEPRAAKSRVWALGFRNPFRMTFRPGTGSANPATGDLGEVYIGDVGWNIWEELNIIKAPGMNCGWPLYEGQTSLTSYYNLSTPNPDEPNPLFGGSCTQSNFFFKNLLKQASPDGQTTVFNPCNISQQIGTNNRYYHRRPSIDWRHGTNSSRVGTFDYSNNTATTAEIGTPASGVIGAPFQGNCSVAGTWYTGDSFPPAYKNTFFQADLGGQYIKRITVDFTDQVTRVDNFGTAFGDLVCITQNPVDGTLITVQINGTGVKRIFYGGNKPPVAKITVDKTFGPGPLTVAFNGSQSSDPDGTIASYSWNFGNGNTSTLQNATSVYTALPGVPTKFTATLTVTDNQGGTSTSSVIISVNNTPPIVQITSPVANSFYKVGSDTTYALTANVIDNEEANATLKYAWQTFLRHNNHQHAEAIDTNHITNTNISRIGCNGDDYYWLVELTVTDNGGLSYKDSVKIYPACTSVLNGNVVLQGRPAVPNAQWQTAISVDFFQAGDMNVPVFTRSVQTDHYGYFSVTGIPAGTYVVTVKADNMLKKVMRDQILSLGNNYINFGLMTAGDINNNNVISLADLSILINTYGKAPGSNGYDGRADLNGDTQISLSDLSLLINNYGKNGDTP